MTRDTPSPLPLRPRPLRGETAESYVHRLARANHLRPSYLRRWLATPSGGYGPIQPAKLAALSGRTVPALLHALPDLAPRTRQQRTRRSVEEDKHRNQARKEALFAAIRQDSRAGLSGRAIARKHNVGHRTIRAALTSATPPPRKKITSRAATYRHLHDHIDAMIAANPAITVTAVWEHLIDDHRAAVSYGTIRTYITKRKTEPPPIAGQT
jgi:hypothetical protein